MVHVATGVHVDKDTGYSYPEVIVMLVDPSITPKPMAWGS